MSLKESAVLEVACNLRGPIESEVDAIERASMLTPKVVVALSESDLLELTRTAKFGGVEAQPGTTLNACKKLAFANDRFFSAITVFINRPSTRRACSRTTASVRS